MPSPDPTSANRDPSSADASVDPQRIATHPADLPADLPAPTRALIERLGLRPHPEGGYYRETFRAPLRLGAPAGERAASTAIYFLLPPGQFSALHRVTSDEVWHHYAGDPVELHLLDEAGEPSVRRLGPDALGGDEPQIVVPAGVWQAAVPVGPGHALCGCTVAPGFEFADFEMPPCEALLARFAARATDEAWAALVTRLSRSDAAAR